MNLLENDHFLTALAHAPEAVLMVILLLWVVPKFQRENRETRIAFQAENAEARKSFQAENDKDRVAYHQEMAAEREAHRAENKTLAAGIRELASNKEEMVLELRLQTVEIRELRREITDSGADGAGWSTKRKQGT